MNYKPLKIYKMKNYNNILTTLLALFLLLATTSCVEEDFLEIAPKSALSTEAIFNTEAGADLFMNEIYKSLPDPEQAAGWGAGSSRHIQPHSTYHNLNMWSQYYISKFVWAGDFRAHRSRDFTAASRFNLYNHGYPAIPFVYDLVTTFVRNTNFFMETVEELKENFSDEWRVKRVAEARVLRAFFYQEMWKGYGGVPLITEVLNQGEMGDDIFRPSASIQEVYEFIVKELGEAANDLPDEVGDGRVTKGAALALKASTELHMAGLAADPRPAAIGNLGDANTYYDACAKTSEQIMNMGTYSLFGNYNDQFLEGNNWNSETIWAMPHVATTNPSLRTYRHGPFATWSPGGVEASYLPTQALIDMYRMDNGLAIDDPASGYDATKPFENREERFYQSILYDGASWANHKFTMNGANGGTQKLVKPGNQISTGYRRIKGTNPSLVASNLMSAEACNSPIFRYAEVLLMYAEAKFSMGQADQSAIDALDEVRQRGGLPTISATYGSTPSIDELMDVIWHERAVELSFEGYKHYWDLIRTRTADIYLTQPVMGIRDADNDGVYEPYKITNSIWQSDAYYQMPILTSWLEKNPVWMDPANQVNGRTAGQNSGW
jgi:hypothetical protein